MFFAVDVVKIVEAEHHAGLSWVMVATSSVPGWSFKTGEHAVVL